MPAELRLERDPEFWRPIVTHPACGVSLCGADPEKFLAALADKRITPLAAEHGGFLVMPLDYFGRVYEFHSMFTPEGWGVEVYQAAVALARRLFATADCLVTYEIEGQWRSRPPRVFRFTAASDFSQSSAGSLRTWILTRAAWEASPAARRA